MTLPFPSSPENPSRGRMLCKYLDQIEEELNTGYTVVCSPLHLTNGATNKYEERQSGTFHTDCIGH